MQCGPQDYRAASCSGGGKGQTNYGARLGRVTTVMLWVVKRHVRKEAAAECMRRTHAGTRVAIDVPPSPPPPQMMQKSRYGMQCLLFSAWLCQMLGK